AARRVAVVSARLRGCDLYHPRRLLLGRQAPLWGKLINQVRQILTQASKQLVPAQAGLLAQRVERIAAERMRQIFGRDILVRAGADPGLGDAAVSAVLQFFYDVPEAAAQHAADAVCIAASTSPGSFHVSCEWFAHTPARQSACNSTRTWTWLASALSRLCCARCALGRMPSRFCT